MKIVLGGSRNLNQVPNEVAQRLDAWMESGAEFLIGDASGIDSALQQYLKRGNYASVVVYTAADSVRNNHADWPFELVETGLKSKSAARHTIKDRRMTELADAGLMLWDQESIGTLANILDLARHGKDVTVYDSVVDDLVPFEGGLGIDAWLSAHPSAAEEARKRLRTYDNRKARNTTHEEGTLFPIDE